jgi:hypothetical protein
MTIGRHILLVLVTLSLGFHTLIAAGDDWQAVRKEAASEPPAICTSFAALVQKEIEKARSIKAALKSSETGAPSSLFEAAQRLMGNKHETDWQREQKRLLEKARAEALALNARYSEQRCGSIDVDQEIARELAPQGYVPLETKTPKPRF